ncbi:uncharacterized protein LOC110233205 [Exaiptasia diaphana]|uniref:Alpha-(1,6)-fucosyltransferase N- and catalytic domain-containing protein n=1 Tax=Exaiptasia diaphana TaxID=2652724 RepID=A0A913WU30_EXADI|nr:uncharacterized protein LOC110233205 [Exaiptasia diaphana]
MRMTKKRSLCYLVLLVVGSLAVLLLRNQESSGLQAHSKKVEALTKHPGLMRELKRFSQSLAEGRKLHRTEICSRSWQDKYIKLHKSILRSKQSPNYLVFNCGGINHGCGGYGNRIGAISTIFLLAVLTNKAFLINWKSNISILDYLQPKNIDWDFSKAKLKGLTKGRHLWGKGFERKLSDDTLLFKGNTKGEFLSWFKRTNFVKFFTHQVELVTSQWYFISGIWKNNFLWKKSRRIALKLRGHKYSFIGCAYDFLFKRTPRFEKLLQDARHSLKWENSVPRIGIHFRAGDFSFKDIKSDSSVFVRLEKYFDCAKRLEKILNNFSPSLDISSMRWFLATDNIEVKQYAQKKYPKKVISLGIQVEHISSIKEPSRAGLEGVLLDNVLLSECDILVLSNSTFSNVALGMGFHSSILNNVGDHCRY